tara:strand:- start:371 stop:928 length:558 start_codon:yes stop_codon:yes gene_type:complete
MKNTNIGAITSPTIISIQSWIRDTSGKINSYILNSDEVNQTKIHAATTAIGNVGSGVDVLMSYVLDSNKLYKNAGGLRITAWGTGANNANSKALKIYFGSQLLGSFALTASQANNWKITALIIRTAVSKQDWIHDFLQTGTANQLSLLVGESTQDETTALTIKCTGEAVANNDITQEGLLIEFLP